MAHRLPSKIVAGATGRMQPDDGGSSPGWFIASSDLSSLDQRGKETLRSEATQHTANTGLEQMVLEVDAEEISSKMDQLPRVVSQPAKRVFLIRHGQGTHNVPSWGGSPYATRDPLLTELGRTQVDGAHPLARTSESACPGIFTGRRHHVLDPVPSPITSLITRITCVWRAHRRPTYWEMPCWLTAPCWLSRR